MLGLFPCVSAAVAATGWRGDGTGSYPEANPPANIGKDSAVIWQTGTPEWSNASPVMVDNRIFICAEPDVLLCLDRDTGKILWQQPNGYLDIFTGSEREAAQEKIDRVRPLEAELGEVNRQIREIERALKENPEDPRASELESLQADRQRLNTALEPLQEYRIPAAHGSTGYTASTPVTDGSRVFMVFGTGVVAAYDLEGNRLWARVVEQPNDRWGHSASPVLSDGRLIVHIRDVHALDPATGETVWTARSGARWGSPVTTTIDGAGVAITAHGEILRAADGKVLADGLHRLDYCAPLVHADVVYFIEHGGKAYRLPATADGTTKPELLWETQPPKERYYASPLYRDGLLYCVNQRGFFSVIDAASGEVVAGRRLPNLRGTVYTSVTGAGPLIFLGSEGGTVLAFEPGREMRQVADANIGNFRSTPVFLGDRAYYRTLEGMFCYGAK